MTKRNNGYCRGVRGLDKEKVVAVKLNKVGEERRSGVPSKCATKQRRSSMPFRKVYKYRTYKQKSRIQYQCCLTQNYITQMDSIKSSSYLYASSKSTKKKMQKKKNCKEENRIMRASRPTIGYFARTSLAPHCHCLQVHHLHYHSSFSH